METTAKKDAWKFVNRLAKAQKYFRKTYPSLDGVRTLSFDDKIQITRLAHLCELLDIEYIREDWDGNEMCESNWDIIYFWHKGFKFFELVEKEKN